MLTVRVIEINEMDRLGGTATEGAVKGDVRLRGPLV